LHAIAFLQWRLKYPNTVRHDEQELTEVIMGRINHLMAELVSEEEISEVTKENSVIAKNFLIKYKMIGEKNVFNINSFSTVAWSDPFPNDDKLITGSLDDGDDIKLPEKVDDWVYPESRYIKGFSPYVIYIPKKEIMLKMMRACIEVKKPEHLWFNTEARVIENFQQD